VPCQSEFEVSESFGGALYILQALSECCLHQFPIDPPESWNIVKDVTPQVIIVSLVNDFSLIIEGNPA
jgi:hypothetical protein